MAGQGASRLNDFSRVASGVALVLNESARRLTAVGKLQSGDIVGSTTATLKFFQNTVADLTGLTQGRVRNYPPSPSGPQRADDSGIRSGLGEEPKNASRESSSPPQPEELFRPNGAAEESGRDPGIGTGTSLKTELYAATDISRRDESPPDREVLQNSADPFSSKIRVDSNLGSVMPPTAAQVMKDSVEKKDSSFAPKEGAAASAESRIPNVVRPMKRRKPRERRVPSTPIGRAMGFAGLGAGLAWGTLQESAKRLWGGQGATPPGQSVLSPFMTEQNAERIALALCRMRGAALKVGQMLSIQDESLVPPQVLAALESVRQGADVMPRSQLNKVLDRELGADWQNRLVSFDYDPIAAASIGQVHRAVLKDGREVAMKIQYPGVANSIDSDIDNVKRLLNYTNLIPKGLYLDQAMKVAKEELARECNYELEAEYQKRFKKLLKNEPGIHVPAVIDEFCSKCVITSELVPGVSIDKVAQMEQSIRNEVGERLLRLTLKELFVFRFMQTDPNWGNFLYDETTHTINLIDFGAARDFSKQFVDDYLRMVLACANKDRDQVLEMSIRLGFLTGDEARTMMDAHTQAAFVTGEPFSKPGPFDFRATNMTRRVSELGATMLRERLTPPPDEAYSLHRKLSGAFLACVKLGAVFPPRDMLLEFSRDYEFSDAQPKTTL
ncbi:aarF domain-containing kinase [Marchantia polymorpha subsp. ruderalis]